MHSLRLAIVSDIHFASAAEQARGHDYEYRDLPNPLLRLLIKLHRRYLWLRNPLQQNHLLDEFIARATGADHVLAVGDYSCNTAFVGVADHAACRSALECLEKLRHSFGSAFEATLGDHELGKFSFVGKRGGMRLDSWRQATTELRLKPFWQTEIGKYTLIGVTSSIIALPIYESETLPGELPEWRRIREQHLADLRRAFSNLGSDRKVLLFCHDPTALPFLGREDAVRAALPRLEQTVIGHLHSNLILRQARLLAGMPVIRFLGHTARRLTLALHEARHWAPFKVRLCPSLAGIELLKDGGFLVAELDPSASSPAVFSIQRLSR